MKPGFLGAKLGVPMRVEAWKPMGNDGHFFIHRTIHQTHPRDSLISAGSWGPARWGYVYAVTDLLPTTAPCGVPSRWKLLDCSEPSACAATESVDAADAAAISAVLVGGLRWKWEGEHKHRERERGTAGADRDLDLPEIWSKLTDERIDRSR